MILVHRSWRGAAMSAILISACVAMPAAAAATKSTVYFAAEDINNAAYVIDWYGTGNKARVAGEGGASTGTYVDDGAQKVITLTTPLSQTWLYTYDQCGTAYAKSAVRQLVVRELPDGQAQTVEIGDYTQIGGCHDGEVTPFGATTDEGLHMKRLAMAARPAMDDLQYGLEMAGFSEDHLDFGETSYAQDVVTFLDNRVRFRATGDTVPAAINAKKWLVMTLPQGDQRAFSRLEVNNTTQGETWMMAGWVKDQPAWVVKLPVVKTLEGAGFGTVAEASRKWESGLFRGSRTPFFIHLYRDSTGERVQKDLDAGTERRTPISEWGFEGPTLWQERTLGGDDVAVRRWRPLRNVGTKTHWVLESESWVADGVDTISIKPRVNSYIDTGKAVKPTGASQASSRVVSQHDKPTVAR